MQSITQDAQKLSLLFQYGVLDARAVISWADSMIEQLDSPPDLLLELSTTAPERTADVLSCLQRLCSSADIWPALRCAMPQLRDFIVSYPDRAESIANQLFLTVCGITGSELPNDLHFIYQFDDAFSLARDGIFGDTETVYREFVREMEKFIPSA